MFDTMSAREKAMFLKSVKADCGWAVAEQAEAIFDDPSTLCEQNSNALDMIVKEFWRLEFQTEAEELQTAIEAEFGECQ